MIDPKTIDFIQENLQEDPEKLVLARDKFPDVDVSLAALQIAIRRKSVQKLPSWTRIPEVHFPSREAFEQSSSEATAAYKASLVSGVNLVDLTGGMGVDIAVMSKKFDHSDYVDINPELVEITRDNFRLLGLKSIVCHACSAEEYLTRDFRADWIMIDPSRRSGSRKVFLWEDSSPNLLELRNALLQKGDHIMVKSSPLMDLQATIDQLECVNEVHVIAVEGECREVLFILSSHQSEVRVITIDLRKNGDQVFEFFPAREQSTEPAYSMPGKYLYEPNAAVLKSGAFKSLAHSYNLAKLHPNTHLYTADELRKGFPGRAFKVTGLTRAKRRSFKQDLPEMKANLTVRNFPVSVEKIRKETGLRDGGDVYLFAATLMDNSHQVVVTEKISG